MGVRSESAIPDGDVARYACGHMLHAGTRLWRIHASRFGAVDYNATTNGSARFSPITDSGGHVIPTLYAATTLEGAVFETLFHSLPGRVPLGGGREISYGPWLGHMVSEIALTQDVPLIRLDSAGHKALGLTENELTHFPRSSYPDSRSWAMKFHRTRPECGLIS